MFASWSRLLPSVTVLLGALALATPARAEGGGAPAGGGSGASNGDDGGAGGAGGSTTIDEESQGPHEESGGCGIGARPVERPALATSIALAALAVTVLRRRRVAG